MRLFAVSDVHVDYDVNVRWVEGISRADYREDALILAGDVSDSLLAIGRTIETFATRFRHVLYIPGNHELWVMRDSAPLTSLEKFERVLHVAQCSGASINGLRLDGLAVLPLFGWYDFSFGEPSADLRSAWMDFHACRWPEAFSTADIARHFEGLNSVAAGESGQVVTFSHFLPRIDVLPRWNVRRQGFLDPVLGAASLDRQIRTLGSTLHVYGHSHANQNRVIDGVRYVNNALGYPHEQGLSSRQLLLIT